MKQQTNTERRHKSSESSTTQQCKRLSLILTLLMTLMSTNAWTGAPRPGTPNWVSAPSTDTDGSYTVSWDSVYGAEWYEISGGTNTNTSGTSLAISGQADGHYHYIVRACSNNIHMFSNPCGYSKSGGNIQVQRPPGTPGGINVPGTTVGNYSLNWGSAAGQVERYEIREAINGSWSGWSNHGTATSKTYSGKSDASYQYQVRACNGIGGCGSVRVSSTFSVLNLPGIPSSISVPSGVISGTFTINWGSASGQVSHYEYRETYNGGSGSWLNTNTSTPKNFSNKSDGSYQYHVRACNNMGCGGERSSNTFMVQTPPTLGSTATAPSDTDGHYALTWDVDPGIHRYELERQHQPINGSWSGWSLLATYHATLDPHEDDEQWELLGHIAHAQNNVAEGDYQYRLKACQPSCGAYSSTVSTSVIKLPGTAPAPSLQQSPVLDNSIQLQWGAAANHNQNYQTEWRHKATSVPTWTTQAWVGERKSTALSSSYTPEQTITYPGLSNGDYQFRVRGCNQAGCGNWSAASAEIEVLNLPNAISALDAQVGSTPNRISLTWQLPSGSEIDTLLIDYWKGSTYLGQKSVPGNHYGGPEHYLSYGEYEFTVTPQNRRGTGPASTTTHSLVPILGIDNNPVDDLGYQNEPDDIGRLEGTLSVTQSGAAHYQLPLDVPPGLGGLSPEISLNYHSDAGNGPLGQGFSLSAVSNISRCHKTRVQDQALSSVLNGDDYRFCLNGQRLVKVAAQTYRTEREDYSKIIASDDSMSPNSWTVYHRDGRQSHYGSTLDSRQSHANQAYRWWLAQINDANDNQLDYTYSADAMSGEHRLDHIDYGNNQSANIALGHRIQFNYQDRPDSSEHYFAGAKQSQTKRLSTIQLYAGGESSASRTYHLDYRFANNPGNNPDPTQMSRIEAIRLCYQAGGCQTADFNWSAHADISNGFKLDTRWQMGAHGDQEPQQLVDLNLDGLADRVTFINAGANPNNNFVGGLRVEYGLTTGGYDSAQTPITPSTDPARNIPLTQMTDMNGDGYPDAVAMLIDRSLFTDPSTNYYRDVSAGVYVALSDTQGGFLASQYWSEDLMGQADKAPMLWPEVQLRDLNADGITDVIRRPYFLGDLGTMPGLGTTFGGAEYHLAMSVLGETGNTLKLAVADSLNPNDMTYHDRQVDMNGDGRLDLVKISGSQVWVMTQAAPIGSEQFTLSNPVLWTDSAGLDVHSGSGEYCNRHSQDINLDGLADVLLACNNRGVKLYINTGTALEYAGVWLNDNIALNVSEDSYLPGGGQLEFTLIDLNQDRYDDIISIDNTGQVQVALGTGSGFTALTPWAQIDPQSKRQLADVNGDGYIDFVIDTDNYHNIDAATYLNPFTPMRIESISNNQYTQTISYSNLSDSEVYEQTDGSIGQYHRQHQIQQSVAATQTGSLGNTFTFSAPVLKTVVKTISRPDGLGGENSSHYHYKGLKTDRHYGSLGFQTRTVTHASGQRTVTDYSQDGAKHLIGHVLRIQRFANNSASSRLSDQHNQWAVRDFNDDLDGDNSPHSISYIENQWTQYYDLTSGTNTHNQYTSKTPASQNDCQLGSISLSVLEHNEYDSPFDHDGNLKHQRSVLCDVINSQTTSSEEHYSYDRIDTGSHYQIGLTLTHDTTRRDAQGTSLTRKQAYSYDAQGRLQTQTQAPDDDSARVTTTLSYHAWGDLHSSTESWSNNQAALLDASGAPVYSRTTTTDIQMTGATRTVTTRTPLHSAANPQQSLQTFDAWGRLIEQTNPLGHTATTSYDAYGRATQVTNNNGSNSISLSNAYKQCSLECSQVPHATRFIHLKAEGQAAVREYQDTLGRVVGKRTTNPQGDHIYTLTAYNSLGHIASETHAHRAELGEIGGQTHYQYDTLGRNTQKTLPSGLVINQTYGPLSQSQSDSQRGFVQQKQSNAAGQLHWVEDANGTKTDYQYDAYGNLIETTLDNSITTSIHYSPYGARLSLIDPSVGTQTDEPHPLGLLNASIDALGQRTENTYDLLGRLVSRVDKTASNTILQSGAWSYNAAGQLTQSSGTDTLGRSNTKQTQYSLWGDISQQTHSINGQNYTHNWHYDQYRRLASREYPQAGSERLLVQQRYNDFGAVAELADSQGNPYWQLNHADSAWGITQATYGNGLINETNYHADRGSIFYQGVSDGSNLIVQNTLYGYDELGNLATRTDGVNNLNESFCYDSLNRLSGVGLNNQSCSSDYQYDAYGNLTHKNAANQNQFYGENGASPYALTQVQKGSDAHHYHYNSKGELTQVQLNNLTQQTHHWTVFGKPKQTMRYQSDPNQSTQTDIIYGPDRTRIERQDYRGGNLQRSVHYVGDYEKVTLANGDIQHRHSLNGIAIVTLNEQGGNQSSETVYLHHDPLGSLFAQSQQDLINSSNAIEHFRFDPWGQRQNPDGSALSDATAFRNSATDRGYTGHEHLDDVNLIHMNGRVYSPESGRFLSPDPLIQAPTYSQSFNRYSYVWNNPLNNIDPSGFAAKGVDLDNKQEGGNNKCVSADGRACEEITVIGERTETQEERLARLHQEFKLYIHSEMVRVQDANTGKYYLGFYTRINTGQVPSQSDNSQSNSNSSPWYSAGIAAGATGLFLGTTEQSLLSTRIDSNGWWKGVNGRWYPPTWAGSTLSGFRSTLTTGLNILKGAGYAFFGIGSAISIAQGSQAFSNGDGLGVAQAGMDFGWGAASTFGGLPGLAGGITYFGTSALINHSPAVRNAIVTPGADALCYMTQRC